ncbi:MAG: HDIG domain-containing protein [Prevotellamassilia sp.]|nr:HDIG domain-containing protein [Prevotellamassilia sp.]
MPANPSESRIESRATLMISVCAAVALLMWFMPRETKFGYEYEQGRPWRYNSLIATFDFPIYKSAEEVRAEKDSALKDFMPFYQKDENVGRNRLKQFRSDYVRNKLGNVNAACFHHVEQMLSRVYEAGILDSEELAAMAQQRTPGIKLLKGTEANGCELAELYSNRSAYEYIMSSDTIHFPREMVAQCNLNQYLEPNLVIDTTKTNAAREDVLSSVSPASGIVQSGQRIIDRGEIVSAEQFRILQSFENETVRRSDPKEGFWIVLVGQLIFVSCIFAAVVAYLRLFRRDYLHSPHSVWLLVSLITIFPLITFIMVDQKFLNIYLVPYAMIPIFVRIFLDSRTAFVSLVASSLLSGFALHSSYEFVLIQFVAGSTAIGALRELTERSQLLRVALFVTLTSELVLLGYEFSQGIDLEHLDASLYIYITINGVCLLFAYPLLYLIEKMFGFTSGVTLIELSNTNNTVLRRMSKVAQGTFIHSLQVANLSAEVADKIGAKPQLARTGAMYHDIGKLFNPAFFTENQSGVNPHDELTEEQSAHIIISHVNEGLRLADKYHLPKVIKDFIRTHHGRSLTRYFYVQWKNKHPEEEPEQGIFQYPGPNPFTREQAIVMMCDAVEATSRSLKDFSEESITALVNKIVDGQVSEGYFKECPITFRDIADAKRVLVENLKTIYHTRIAYPEINSTAQKTASATRRPSFFGRR